MTLLPLVREGFIYFVFLARWSVANAYHDVTCVSLPSAPGHHTVHSRIPCIWAAPLCAWHSCHSHLILLLKCTYPPITALQLVELLQLLNTKEQWVGQSPAYPGLQYCEYGVSQSNQYRDLDTVSRWLAGTPKLDGAPSSLDYYSEKW